MKRPLRLVVIGGVAAGTKAASKARREDPSMEITIVTREQYISYAGCGLAYFVGDIVDDRRKLFARSPEAFKEKQNITVLLGHNAERIITYDNIVLVRDLSTGAEKKLPYDRLLIATGAHAVVPQIEGAHGEGVFPLHLIPDADSIREYIQSRRVGRACVVGGGYIGVELAESLVRKGIEVTLIEKMPSLLPLMYEPEMSRIVEDHVRGKGITVVTGAAIDAVERTPDGGVSGVRAGGNVYSCELVIFAVGVRPTIDLAENARITLGETGAIKVSDKLETNVRGHICSRRLR